MKLLVTVCLTLLAFGNVAHAAEAGDWKLRAGPYVVAPESDNSPIATVDNGISLGFNFTYFYSPNWAIEVLAATPFSHDVDVIGDVKAAEVKHLPPTVTLQYHFDSTGSFHPYVGLGLNYTTFFDEETTAGGVLAGTDLELDDSFGFAVQFGADLDLNEKWFLNFDVRYINIETDATVDDVPLIGVDINPWVVGATVGTRF
ncbi:MAG: OmpW family outer membrane protein [Woeseiaceae bacterium]|nr:OmpW family outer membrane protein [Woeseiaceae bacterium]